jgi:hypothetical protein
MLPADPYHYLESSPHAGGARPLNQGDVFLDIPLLRAAVPDPRHRGQWKASVKVGTKALGMLVTHPCSSRARGTGTLKESVSIAPVSRCPKGFEVPWDGFYEYFPLPGLRDGKDYAADLSAVCPVRSEHLRDRRIACLSEEGLAALFHRIALNSSRLDRIPDHFASEAQRLFFEMGLWEQWTTATETEDGFQAWLDEPVQLPPIEDPEDPLAATAKVAGLALPGPVSRRESGSDPEPPSDPPAPGDSPGPVTSRREALRWHHEHIVKEMETNLGSKDYGRGTGLSADEG